MADMSAVLTYLVTANTAPADAALAKTQANLQATSKRATTTGAVMKKAFLGVGLAAVGAGAALAKIGQEFDDAYDIIHSRTQDTGKDLRELKEAFRGVVASTPTDFDTAAKAVAGIRQHLDLTGRSVEGLAKQLTSLSKITGEDIDTTVTSVTRLFGDWSVATEDQKKTLDGLFRVTRATGIQFNDLSQLMVQFGSPLRQLGFDLEESAAMFARFEREGVNMQTLLPGLRMALKNLSIPTDDLAKLMDQLGVNGGSAREKLFEVFDLISSGKVKEADKTLLASSVFGGRAWADMKAAIEEGRFEFDELIATMKKGEGTIRGTERQTRDFAEHWQVFANNVKLAVEPMAKDVFATLSGLMKDVSKAFREGGLDAVGDLLMERLSAAVPDIIEAGKKLASTLAQGFVKAWTESDLLGKLFVGTAALRMFGGKGALLAVGASIGKFIGLGVGAGAAAGMSGGSAVGGAAAGAAGTGIAGKLSSALGKIKWGRVAGIGIGVSLADAALQGFQRESDKNSSEWQTAISGIADAPSFLGVESDLFDVPDTLKSRFDQLLDLDFKGLFGEAPTEARDLADRAADLRTELTELFESGRKIDLAELLRLRQAARDAGLAGEAYEGLSADLRAITELAPSTKSVFKSINDQLRKKFDLNSINDIIAQIEMLPESAQQNAAAMTVAMARELEQKGELPKGATKELLGWMSSRWDEFSDKGVKAVIQMIQNSGLKMKDLPKILKGHMDAATNAIVRGVRTGEQELGHLADVAENKGKKTGKGIEEPIKKGVRTGEQELGHLAEVAKDSFGKVTRESDKMRKGTGGNFASLNATINSGLENIGQNTNSALKAFGVKPLNFAIVDGKKTGTSGLQKGGVATVPGYGSGDKVPAMLEPGEVVVNKKAVAAMGGPNKVNAINSAIPRFQRGGQVGGNLGQSFDVDGAQPGFVPFMNFLNSMFGPIYVMSGNRPGAVTTSGTISNHASGRAVDISTRGIEAANSAASLNATGALATRMDALHSYMASNIDLPGDFLWRTTSGGNHYNHIHRGITSAHASDPGMMIDYLLGLPGSGGMTGGTKIKRQILEGPDGPLKDMGQGALDKARKAANKYIAKKAGAANFAGGPLVAPPHSGGQYSVADMSQLWSSQGGPRSQAHVAGAVGMAESMGDPNAYNPSGASGLWQILGQVVAGDIFDPVVNAKNAIKKYNDANGWSPWEAYTNGAYQQYMDRGGIVQKLTKGGIVRDFLDTWRQAEGGKGDQRKALSQAKKKIKKLDVPGMAGTELGDKLLTLQEEQAKFEEYASNASSLTSEDDNGVVTEGIFKGHTELDWLGGTEGFRGRLQALHEFRNKLATSLKSVKKIRALLDKLMKQAERRLRDLRNAIRKGERARRTLEKEIEKATDKKEASTKAMQARLEKEMGKDPKDRDEDLIASLREGIRTKSTEKEALQNALKKLNQKQTARNALKDALALGSGGLLQTLGEQRTTIGDAATTLTDELNSVQGTGGPLKPNIKVLPQLGELGGYIFDVQQRLHEMGLPKTSSTDTTEGQEFTNQFLMDELLKANQRFQVSQAQYAVFRDFAGGFAEGGYIPGGKWGVVGERGPEVISGPNTVTPIGGDGVTVVVNGDIINTPPGMQPVEVQGAKTIVQQGSRGYGRRPLGSAKGY